MYAWRVASARLLAEPQAGPPTKGMIGATATSRVAVFAAAPGNAAGIADVRVPTLADGNRGAPTSGTGTTDASAPAMAGGAANSFAVRAPVVGSTAVSKAAAARATAAADGASTASRGRVRRTVAAAKAGAPRIVMGFGNERIDDVRAYDANVEADALDRHAHRVNQGDRGRMRDADNRDLDRSAGGAWHSGRRS